MSTTQGRRLYVSLDDTFHTDKECLTTALLSTMPGDYWKSRMDGWVGKVPTGARCGLRKHTVSEHEDGTITVAPSILLTCPGMDELNWHGYLERGVWRSC